MKIIEANLDGLVGPTHHYGGLSFGNVASAIYAQTVSNPREAALQGLAKMKFLRDLGVPQLVLPPPPRPVNSVLEKYGSEDLAALSVAYSASSMWAANAATVSASSDTKDKKVHFTPANLISTRHRALEAEWTASMLQEIFPAGDYFTHHAALPSKKELADEGAANHMRLALGEAGIELFVYGRSKNSTLPGQYPARYTREAAEAIAKSHKVRQSIFIQQNPEAIDAGVFHNDVIVVGHESLLMLHEKAWKDQARVLETLQHELGGKLTVWQVAESEIPLKLAVSTYLFNSQIVTLPKGGMALIAPAECEEEPRTREWIKKQTGEIIREVHYLNLRESMKNGGGPACLRLRVVLNEAERKAVNPAFWLSDALYEKLSSVIKSGYRDRLVLDDLKDPAFASEALSVQERLIRAFC